MVQIGKVFLHKPPYIALSITDQESNDDILRHKISLLELRVDKFSRWDIPYVKDQMLNRQKTGIPLLLTVRCEQEEGGDGQVSNAQKKDIFSQCAELADAVDVELSSPIRDELIPIGKSHRKTVIVSSHNFLNTPDEEELEKILEDSLSAGADIVKIACWAQTESDVQRLGRFTEQNRQKNLIAISLGETGAVSRVTFAEVGSLLTYSFIGQAMAPGQMPVATLEERLKEHYPEF